MGNWKQTSYAMVYNVRNTGQEAVLLAMLATCLESLKSGGGGARSQVEPRQGWTKTLMKYTYSTCLLIVITLSLSVCFSIMIKFLKFIVFRIRTFKHKLQAIDFVDILNNTNHTLLKDTPSNLKTSKSQLEYICIQANP